MQAILAMVNANLGISLVQLADPGLCELYPARVIKLGPQAPVLQFSVIVRKKDDDNRGLVVVRDVLIAATSDSLSIPVSSCRPRPVCSRTWVSR